jgi:hypothetical protein
MMNCDRPVCSTVWQQITESANRIVTKCLWIILKPPTAADLGGILPIIRPKKSPAEAGSFTC